MSYKEEFKIYCSTIAGEAGGSSDEAIKTVARSIITRTGFREWESYTTAFEVIKNSGYDAYTDRSSSPNYKAVYNAMSSGKLDDLSRKIIKLVEPIYKQELPDETGMLSLYYSPKAQKALHKKNPKKYKEKPLWNFSVLERVYIAGTSKDDFSWYRYKGDGSTVKTLLLNSVNSPVSGKKIKIKVTDRLGKYFVKEYTTNNKGEIPDIHTRKKSMIEFFVGEKSCKSRIATDGTPKKVVLKDYECKFETQTVPHETIPIPSIDNAQTQENQNSSREINEHNGSVSNSLEEVTFNIKLVEADTGKELPDTNFYLEYKNNIKIHQTDSLGVDSNIRANVCESINVLLDDDDGKKQSVYSMAFPVTEDLHGITKVLRVPVVHLNVQFVDKNNRPISGQQFRTVYRGRTSEIRKANAQGRYKIKALAGQKIRVIYEPTREVAECIVTDGNNKITYTVNGDKKKESVKSENKNNVAISDNQSNDTLTKKEDVIRQDVKTDRGPTHQIKSTSALIKIKFLDEATNKPLSGLTYITQSTKYGKNNSVTGSDGTRGRPHESEVGVTIDVLVYENGKEVKKGSFVANSDRVEPYVYKAKKPKKPNVQVLFNNVDRQSIVSQKSRLIIAELAEQCGMSKIYITSTLRTPEEQARAMWGKKSLYGPIGREVHDVGSRYNKYGETRRTKEMAKAIRLYLDQGKRTSNHCVTFEIYSKLNVVDLGNNSNGFVYYKNKKKYLTALGKKFKIACDEAKKAGRIKKYISGDGAEGAFHLEIPQ